MKTLFHSSKMRFRHLDHLTTKIIPLDRTQESRLANKIKIKIKAKSQIKRNKETRVEFLCCLHSR
jgi:hypothetical protein